MPPERTQVSLSSSLDISRTPPEILRLLTKLKEWVGESSNRAAMVTHMLSPHTQINASSESNEPSSSSELSSELSSDSGSTSGSDSRSDSDSDSESDSDVPNFTGFATVRGSAVGVKTKGNSEFVSVAVARGLWINQQIMIREVMAPIKPRPSGRCSACRKAGRSDCVVLACDREQFGYFSDRCGHCVRAGVPCNDSVKGVRK